MTSIGNVRIITSDCRKGTSRRAEYRDLDSRVALSGNARVWPDQGFVSGEDIFLWLPREPAGVAGDCVRKELKPAPRHPQRAPNPESPLGLLRS